MEAFGSFFNEEWQGLNRMFMDHEDSDQFNKLGLISSQCDIGLNLDLSNIFLCASDDSSNADSFVVDDKHLLNVSDNINPNFFHFLSQENSISSSGATNDTISLPYSYLEGSFPFCSSNIVHSSSNDTCDTSIQYCMMDEINNSSLPTQVFSNANLYLPQDVVVEKFRMDNSLVSGRENSLKRMLETPDAVEDEVNNEITDKNPKKRTRVSRENKKKKNVKSKNQKTNETKDGNNNINDNGERNGQTSSSCSSNDELNESQDVNVALNPNAKTRASRGTATDPQSLYARKRRERINERLRILQNLVPNGTKVDISTMLEETVEYVKFLKLQIELLSSDDTWMFAPIAYNGMDMGLYQNLRPTQ